MFILISYSTPLLQCLKSVLHFKYLRQSSLHVPTYPPSIFFTLVNGTRIHRVLQVSNPGIMLATSLSSISSHLTQNPSTDPIGLAFEYIQNSAASYHLHCYCFNLYFYFLSGFCNDSNCLLTSFSAFQPHLSRRMANTLKISNYFSPPIKESSKSSFTSLVWLLHSFVQMPDHMIKNGATLPLPSISLHPCFCFILSHHLKLQYSFVDLFCLSLLPDARTLHIPLFCPTSIIFFFLRSTQKQPKKKYLSKKVKWMESWRKWCIC